MISMIFTANPTQQPEGDRLFASHAKWMEKTHHKTGDLALLQYNIAKGVEYNNPLDPSSGVTGNAVYTLYEVYAKPEGLADHWKMGQETWEDFGAFMGWATDVDKAIMHGVPVIHSLW